MDIMDGPQGVQGPQGEKGDTGAVGPQGEPGQDAPQDVVRYAVQSLDTEQQMQARKNIGAADAETVNGLKDDVTAITPDDSAVDGKPWTSEKIVEALCPPFETTGSIVRCHPVEHYPLGVVSRIDATQSGTGDASPDNIRPIVGWDSVSVTRCRKNLVKSFSLQGQQIDLAARILPNETITVSFDGVAETDGNTAILYTHDIDGTVEGAFGFTTKVGTHRYTGTRTPDRGIGISYIRAYRNSTFLANFTSVSNWQIELGSTATTYEPYTGDTYTAELPETIYGGELDWNTGVLTVTHGQMASYAGETLPGEWISDRDVYAPDATPTTGAQVAYKLAEPYTVQLTPQQITALSGTNTLYTDSGDTAVSGRADPVWLTQSLMERIAALESAATNI